jgi:hypothetical protein
MGGQPCAFSPFSKQIKAIQSKDFHLSKTNYALFTLHSARFLIPATRSSLQPRTLPLFPVSFREILSLPKSKIKNQKSKMHKIPRIYRVKMSAKCKIPRVYRGPNGS